ncbi:hypothetical protein [Micrococcus luteus]|uniref:hypothetical protein n=1 Tax=Micrococcus luteus TaxID=1270 RepID=UPI0011A3FAA5|nr:hypothetical protein [Micrococcus luteus]
MTATSPVERPLDMTCGSETSPMRPVKNLKEAWKLDPASHTGCYVEEASVSDVQFAEEKAALTVSPDTSLRWAYTACAQTMMGNIDKATGGPYMRTESQRDEVRAAMALCPSHPDIEKVRLFLGDADVQVTGSNEEQQAPRDTGLVRNGTYRVGTQVKPGTYVAETKDTPMEGCYWEVNDSTGNIMDNKFVNSAFRVEMTIPADAASVTIKRCVAFKQVD